jgi:hypothetical protein
MQYIYSKKRTRGLRGGTEQIEELLLNTKEYKKIKNIHECHNNENIIFIGIGLKETLSIYFSSKGKINISILKSATYSKIRSIVEFFLHLFLTPLFQVIVITKSQRLLYPLSKYINIYDLYISTGFTKITNKKKSRKYEFGYVGRVDEEKGYFVARDLMISLSIKKKCLLDILIWSETELKDLPKPNNNLTIIHGRRQKGYPIYKDIKNLILPYKSLQSTIVLPLVTIEALLNGCNVYTSPEVRKILKSEAPKLIQNVYSIEKIYEKIICN